MARLRQRLGRLYGADADRCLERLRMMVGRYGVGIEPAAGRAGWGPEDAVLIAYGDMIRPAGGAPLAALKRFADERLAGAVNTVHLLPFFPYSSDDGFSVVHFRTVNPDLGGWADVQALGEKFRLAFDLVLNHVSRKSGWFKDYLLGIAPGRHYFIQLDPATDLSTVVRPRSTPLLSPVITRDGARHVWTTFSDDQVDLDFANPDVLFEMLDILLFYVSMGARIVRLDAIAYLWKKPGTPCIHLPETHEVVKLFRDVLSLVAPEVLLLSETNVPQAENLSYFGEGDEAQIVYQFPLPPLVLHALASGTAEHLSRWARAVPAPPPGCTFLNFTASHDGIGLRPLEGLVPAADIARLAEHARARGGEVSMKRDSDGRESPYELNISYFDAMGGDDLQIPRFLCSQTIPLALKGIPAIYFNSLVAAPNDAEGVRRTGRARSINRKKWTEDELSGRLQDPSSVSAQVFGELTRRLRVRAGCAAFHPDAKQEVLNTDPRVFAVRRTASGGGDVVTALANVSPETVEVGLESLSLAPGLKDLLGDAWIERGQAFRLAPYQCAWFGGGN